MGKKSKPHQDESTGRKKPGQIASAIDEVLRMLKEEPGNPEVYYKYAQLLRTAGESEEVAVQLKEVLTIDPYDYRVENDLAVLYYNEGKFDQALEHLQKAASSDNNVVVHQNLGRLLTELGRYDEAMAEFEKAVTQMPASRPDKSNEPAEPSDVWNEGPSEKPTSYRKSPAIIDLISLRPGLRENEIYARQSFCTVCGATGRRFLPLGKHNIDNLYHHGFKYLGRCEMTSIEEYACPSCGASDRQRLYALWFELEASAARFRNHGNLIHFAPERPLERKLASMQIFDVMLTADLSMKDVDFHADITRLPFPAESFDTFICSHVLEHVEDDDMAISELYRVTKRGGRGILMTPIAIGPKHTIEGKRGLDAGKRWGLYGQDDHVRLYSHDDFVAKALYHGFHLLELGIDYFGESLFERLGLLETSVLYIAEKW